MTSLFDLYVDLARAAALTHIAQIGSAITADTGNAVALLATMALKNDRAAIPRV